LHPNGAELWLQAGLARLGLGKPKEAIAAFQKSSELDPDMAEAYNFAGAMEFEGGEPARAEAALREAIRVQPNYAPARNNLGNLLAETDRFPEAEEHFKAALQFQENYVGARYNYALALNRVHRLADAQAQVEAILAIQPASAEAHEFLGNLFSAQGLVQRAIQQYREAIRIVPTFSRAILDLGVALAKSGDAAAALPYLRTASQSTDPGTREEARKLLERLEQVK
jgi:tetratricopeptide (TPR) repeat protein